LRSYCSAQTLSCAALYDIPDTQLTAHNLHVHRLALVDEGGVSGDHREGAPARETSDQLFDQTGDEVVLIGVAAQVVERQNSDGRATPEPGNRQLVWPIHEPEGQANHEKRAKSGCRPEAPLASGSNEGTRRFGSPGDREYGNPPLHVLQLLVPQGASLDVWLVLDEAVDLFRNADPSRLRKRSDARCDVDSVSMKGAVPEDHVPQMDPDTHPEFAFVLQRRLDREGTVHGIHRAREAGERLVPDVLDPIPVVLLDERPQDCTVPLANPMPLLLALPHQGRVAHDVGEHDGCELAFDPFCGHRRPPARNPFPGSILRLQALGCLLPLQLGSLLGSIRHVLSRFATV
jgi:hypothetical protein